MRWRTARRINIVSNRIRTTPVEPRNMTLVQFIAKLEYRRIEYAVLRFYTATYVEVYQGAPAAGTTIGPVVRCGP